MFVDINDIILIKRIPYKGNITNLRKHLHTCKHNANITWLINEQIQTCTKHDAIFQTANAENNVITENILNETAGNITVTKDKQIYRHTY